MSVFRIGLEPIVGRELRVEDLHRSLVTQWIAPVLRNNIKHNPRTSHTNALGALLYWLERDPISSATDGLVYDLSSASGDSPLSEAVAQHWMRLAWAQLRAKRKDIVPWMSTFGVAPADPVPSVADLTGPGQELAFLEVGTQRKVLVGVRQGRSDEILVDAGVGPASFAELSSADQERVNASVRSGLCECFLCKKLRPKGS